MPQMSPLFLMNYYIMFLLSLILVLVVLYFMLIYCKLDLMVKKDQEIEKVWKW